LGGHIATAEAWAQFAKDWEALLPSGTLAENDRHHFKMSEMALNDVRMWRVPPFYRIIEEHVLLSISFRFNIAEFERAKDRAREFLRTNMLINFNFAFWGNPYYFAFRILMDRFHFDRQDFQSLLPIDRKVDFIFDYRTEKGPGHLEKYPLMV